MDVFSTDRAQLDNFKNMLNKHILVPVQTTGPIEAYYLKDPAQGRMMSTLIMGTPEGISLMGDLTPERNGSASCLGYDLRWFSGASSNHYLCEKFLTKRWVQEIAVEQLSNAASHFGLQDGDADIAKLKEIGEHLKGSDHLEEWLYDELFELGGYTDGGLPGYGYDPREAMVLCAIQARFSELYP